MLVKEVWFGCGQIVTPLLKSLPTALSTRCGPRRVNKGAGYGLEVPSIYRVFGPPVYVCRMRELVNRGTFVMNVNLVLAFI